MELKYKISLGRAYIYLNGELDEYTAHKTRDFIDDIIENQTFNEIVLNLEGLSFMDSTGIGIIIGRYKKLSSVNIPLLYEKPTRQVEKIIKASGLFNILKELK